MLCKMASHWLGTIKIIRNTFGEDKKMCHNNDFLDLNYDLKTFGRQRKIRLGQTFLSFQFISQFNVQKVFKQYLLSIFTKHYY